ncbi:hypothetical protein ID866_6485 [Astraeus odoratus]|nr:hypothetical protein ID866_6485 [Astraeus odoratus]
MLLPLLCVAIATVALAAPTSEIRPLVLWHGLGDNYASDGILQFQDEVKRMHPGIFVHSIYIDSDASEDKRASFYGNVNSQIALVANQLASIPQLERGFDAVGFSQGGQFLRGYIERYNDPPVYNLITFGSQHMGVSDIPACRSFDILCEAARRAVKAGVYSAWAQEHVIQAQYFRDPAQLGLYMTANTFLADINNEVLLPPARNATYAHRLASLQNLVLVLFEQDKTVVPKESAWFGSEAPPGQDLEFSSSPSFESHNPPQRGYQLSSPPSSLGSHHNQRPFSPVTAATVVPMRLQPLYIDDYIGLRSLDEREAVTLATCPGEHMQLTGCWEDLMKRWIGQPFP